VIEGYDVVQKVEDVPKGVGDKPVKAVKIAKSGELNAEQDPGQTAGQDAGKHSEL
jgi:peptidyl-prolyl cis-trans isomerase B (cyclophilin B)